MLDNQALIQRQQSRPAILRLHAALTRLKSTAALLCCGAHPDDESSALLSALSLRDGVRVVVAVATRGEGGQNSTGPERGGDLGAIRTREMEEAARILDVAVRWLGQGPDDPLHDFGFSKSADDTFGRWGHDRVVERLTAVIRAERPDIVMPTFLDVPGQHGHHRAMTVATAEAIQLAADAAAFPEQIADGLAPWAVAKHYLPAWSGKGNSYDDDRPPPPMTVAVDAGDRHAPTGATYAQIAEWSRARHRSQGMGIWREAGPSPWPLHRVTDSDAAPAAEASVLEGLPATLGDLARLASDAATAESLATAQAAVDRALAAWPDPAAVAKAAAAALEAVRAALAARPPQLADLLDHRLRRKERELGCILFEASGLDVRAFATPPELAPGRSAALTAVARGSVLPAAVTGVALRLGPGYEAERTDAAGDHRFTVQALPGAAMTSPYPAGFDPLGGNGDGWIDLRFALDGVEAMVAVDLDQPLRTLPAVSVALMPASLVLNVTRPQRPLPVRATLEALLGMPASIRALALDLPHGWTADGLGGVGVPAGGAAVSRDVVLRPPAALAPGLIEIAAAVDDEPARTVRRLGHGAIVRSVPAILRICALKVALPDHGPVGYVGGGNDHVGDWLERLGLTVQRLDAPALGTRTLADLRAIVVGIQAFGARPDLVAATDRLHRWVLDGGHLVTLYHRPWDGWDPDRTPLASLAIGQPSVRWRVTDPTAEVRHRLPRHTLLTKPNAIGPDDWAGWHKERGLYFARSWNPAYEPLLTMADPGEAPLHGALVTGRFGLGRHTHVALSLHHQLDQLVSGAFRLLANLVQAA